MRINEIRYETKISLEKYDEERITMTCYLDDEDTVEGAIAYCRKVSRGDIPYKPLAKELFPDEVIKEISTPLAIVPKKEEIVPIKEPKKDAIKKEIAEKKPKKEIAPISPVVEKQIVEEKIVEEKIVEEKIVEEKIIPPTFTKVVLEDKAPEAPKAPKNKYQAHLDKWVDLSFAAQCAVEHGIRKENGEKLNLGLYDKEKIKAQNPGCLDFKNVPEFKTPISSLLSKELPYDEYEVETVRPYILETVQKVNRTCPMYFEDMTFIPEYLTLFWEEIFEMSQSAHDAILRLSL